MLGTLECAVRASVDVEEALVAAQRLLQCEGDGDGDGDGNDEEQKYDHEDDQALIVSEAEWPFDGRIVIKNLSVRHRSDSQCVLEGICLNIDGGEKVAVCSRNEAEAESLLFSLCRLVEPEEGAVIEIDGVNCLDLGLCDLRSSLSMIPRRPLMLSGTLRFNLDPFDEHNEEELWEALTKCMLYDLVESKEQKLCTLVAGDDEEWSLTQKRLLCVGRALLKKSMVLLLDHGDDLIQELIRKQFGNATVICTVNTNRLSLETVMHYDRVLVLSRGRVRECDWCRL